MFGVWRKFKWSPGDLMAVTTNSSEQLPNYIFVAFQLQAKINSIQFLYYPFLMTKASERGFQSKKKEKKKN